MIWIRISRGIVSDDTAHHSILILQKAINDRANVRSFEVILMIGQSYQTHSNRSHRIDIGCISQLTKRPFIWVDLTIEEGSRLKVM